MFNVKMLTGISEELDNKVDEQVFGDMSFDEAMEILEDMLGGDEGPITIDKICIAIGAAYGCLYARFFMSEFLDEDTRYTDLDAVEDGGELVEKAFSTMFEGLKKHMVRYSMVE